MQDLWLLLSEGAGQHLFRFVCRASRRGLAILASLSRRSRLQLATLFFTGRRSLSAHLLLSLYLIQLEVQLRSTRRSSACTVRLREWNAGPWMLMLGPSCQPMALRYI